MKQGDNNMPIKCLLAICLTHFDKVPLCKIPAIKRKVAGITGVSFITGELYDALYMYKDIFTLVDRNISRPSNIKDIEEYKYILGTLFNTEVEYGLYDRVTNIVKKVLS